MREARARLVADPALGGPDFGAAFAHLLDETLGRLFEEAGSPERTALVALGSYAREELCPGSDVDLLLAYEQGGSVKSLADALWYPLWDAGLVVGHATRTIKEAVALADADLDALTSMLDVRYVSGDPALAHRLVERVRALARRRHGRLVTRLAEASAERREALIGDLLEPDLKEGGGGLRDLQSLVWAGWGLREPGGLASLVAGGYLRDDDPARLRRARDVLLTARVALHRVTGRRTDDLRLEDQDAVAATVGRGDADDLMRELASEARWVAWTVADVWSRLRSTQGGPLGRLARRDRELGDGVVLRDGRVTLHAEVQPDARAALRVACEAAGRNAPIDRDALARLGASAGGAGWGSAWSDGLRGDFLALLRQGRRAVPVIEALDHAGVWTCLLPEWEHVRFRPQRNAYHRFTVDRHLLETVAGCVELLEGSGPDDPETAFDREVAQGLDRPDLLVLGALLHDIGKGLQGDHSEAGADVAVTLCRRIGLDDEGTGVVERVVRHHLLLADVATRRDLAEEATVARVARLVEDALTLEVLYVLTVADSRATGPAAWNSVKAALVRELFVKALHLLDRGEAGAQAVAEVRDELARQVGTERAASLLDAMPPAYVVAFPADVMARHLDLLDRGETGVEWREEGGLWICTVVARDRPGMFAAVAGALALHGLNVTQAGAHTRDDGMALEVFHLVDEFGRLQRYGVERVTADIRGALEGDVDVAERIRDRARQYAGARRRTAPPTPPRVYVDQEASDFATVVEVHADDRVGLLFQITSVLADLGLDLHLAKVSTIGDRVVDAFYVRDAAGGKLADAELVDRLRHSLLGRLQRF